MKGKGGKQDRDLTWWRWAFPLVTLAVLIYLNSLPNEFVFDDIPLIQDNQQIRAGRDLAGIFGGQGYRPVRTLTYALNYWIFGLQPFYFHLTNVLLHAANAVLVFLFLRRLFQDTWCAFAGALLFVCHPAQTAAVAYISGRKDLLACGFIMAGMMCFANFRERGKRSSFFASLGMFTLALFSKEVAVVFPALLFAWDFFERRLQPEAFARTGLWSRTQEVLTKYRWFYASLLIAAAVFLYYAQFIMYASRRSSYWGGSALNNYLTSFKLFTHYLQKALLPYPLIADYDGVFPLATGLGDFAAWAGIFVALAYCLLLYQSLRRRPRMALGLFWFLVSLLPVIQLLPFHEIAADHYLYLPLVGFIIALVELVNWKFSRLRGPALRLATSGVIVVCCVMTIARNRDWRDTRSLWEATVRQAPGSGRVHNNLGTTLHAGGDLDRALQHLLRATKLDAGVAAYWSNLGAVYHDRGDYEAAIGALRRSVEIEPNNPYNHTNLGNAYKKLAMSRVDRDPNSALWRSALTHLERAVILNASNAALHYNLGSAYFELGQRKDARHCFEIAGRLRPDFAPAHYALGLIYSQERDLPAAIQELERSIALDAHNLEAIQLLATLHQGRGEYEGARVLLESAVDQFPSSSDLRLRLALLYKTLGDPAKAREQLNLALQLDPDGGKTNEIHQLLNSL
ncbi:MAG: tetratricopeptide repeat protein [Acidobacteria bacterium]|nr:tetratricopeptide repeat protein [Acidobacteriota bacterium]